MSKPIYSKMFLLAMLLMVFLSACAPTPAQDQNIPAQDGISITPLIGTSASSSSLNLSSITPQSPTANPTIIIGGTPGEGGLIIGMNDNGSTLELQPGQRFSLMLDDSYNWEINIADPSVVNRAIGVMPIKGSQGIFQALEAGQTVLDASGDPLCRSETPACMRPSIIFSLNITVK